MGCTTKIKYLTSNGRPYWVITNQNGISVSMPSNSGDPKDWNYIQFRLEKGDRIADAYEKAGCSEIIPPDYLKQSIKDIYLYSHTGKLIATGQINPTTGKEIFAAEDIPYGDWVNQQACQCLNMTDDTGRINLGDGFVVPNMQEQDCIRGKVFPGSLSENLSLAYYECASDIIPPTESIAYIENMLKTSIQDFYAIIKDAHNTYKAAHGITHTGSNDSDRVLLGDGFTIPSTGERALLYDAVLKKGYELAHAYSVICPDITPPPASMACLDAGIKSVGTMTDWSVFYNDCHDEYVKANPPAGKNSNLLVWGLLVVLGLAVISER